MDSVKILPMVENTKNNYEFEVEVMLDFIDKHGEMVTNIITAENESDRRLLVKLLIAKVVEFTREY